MNNSKEQSIKDINKIAKKANKEYIKNKYLYKKLNLYNNYNDLIKKNLQKYIPDKDNPPFSLTHLTEYTTKIKNDSQNYKNDYNNLFSKLNTLLDECRSDVSMGKPILTQKKSEEFTLDYLKIEKNNTIQLVKDSIKSSYNHRLFREPKRDNLIDIKKGNKLIEKIELDLQNSMINKCKQLNRYNKEIKINSSKILNMNKNIELIDKYVEKNKFVFSNYKAFSRKVTKNIETEQKPKKKLLMVSERIPSNLGNPIPSEEQIDYNSDDDRTIKKPKKNNNKIILDFMKVETLFDVSYEEGENETIIDNELHSDDENIFDKNTKLQKHSLTNHINDIKKIVPSFNFKQIEFNRNKPKEIDIYSLQRREYKKNTLNNQIKDMRKKIFDINSKLSYLKQKEIIMNEFVKKLKENYEAIQPMIYQKSDANIIQEENNFIVNNLNKDTEEEKDENKLDDDFLNDIEEIDEVYFKENEEKEKSDEKKETKDTKEDKKEEYDEKKLEDKILKSVLNKNVVNFKKKEIINENSNVNANINSKLNKSTKTHKKKLLMSLTSAVLKKNMKKDNKRAKSK